MATYKKSSGKGPTPTRRLKDTKGRTWNFGAKSPTQRAPMEKKTSSAKRKMR
jgi:hypothetical protein